MITTKLTNTLTRQKEPLKPLKSGEISLYTCGPTVYRPYTIGNLRNAVFNDTLKRTLQQTHQVKHIMNITDVGHLTSDADSGEDKLQAQAKAEGRAAREVADHYTKLFLEDTARLNILPPTKYVKATETIDQQVKVVQTLLDKGFAYQAKQAIYFDVTKSGDYGKLSGQKLSDKETAVREEVVTDPEKRHPWDFALWFFTVGHFQDHELRWDSPWGEGFPGWHLECSAIIEQELGETIDIHTGGVDHIGTHHTNEIAQSEAAHDGKPLANIWVHNEFLLVDGQKMSKSLGNVYTLQDVVDKGFHPLALRLLYLQAHYRTQQNFTWESLEAAQNSLLNIYAWADLVHQADPDSDYGSFQGSFDEAMADDLGTPQALALLNQLIGKQAQKNIGPDTKLLEHVDGYLGLQLTGRPDISPEQKELIQSRENAREKGDYKMADEIRENLRENGLEIDDTAAGPRWRRTKP